MKKSLIALAVLAASGAAMAQSSVTLYGIADVWVGGVDNGTTTTTKMISGGVSTSRWGMKGSEDLGGGLKANFQLESAITLDDGVSNGFNRQAWVGLSGGFGDVRFGRNSTPYDDFAAGSHGAFDSDVAPMNLGGFPSTSNYFSKTPNTIKYVSPSMGGFTGAVSYAMDEKAVAVPATLGTPATAAGKEVTSLGLNYAAGALGAQLVFQQETAYQSNVDTTFVKGGVSYNFGMATAKGYIAQTSDLAVNGADVDEWQVALDFPLSPSMTLSGSYASADYNRAAGDKEVSGFGVALAYSLSKRTTLYVGYGAVDTDNAVGADTDVSAYAVGVKHAF